MNAICISGVETNGYCVKNENVPNTCRVNEVYAGHHHSFWENYNHRMTKAYSGYGPGEGRGVELP